MSDSPLDRIRQHHGIEHATVSVLFEQRGGRTPVAGLSDPFGYTLAVKATLDEIESAATEALRRLQQGESELAVTDLCGSSIVVSAAMATGAAFVAAGRSRWKGFPSAVGAASLALIASPAAGRAVQRHFTTDANVGARSITGIRRYSLPGARSLFRVAVS